MTQEEKKLLFQDLSARLPYGVKVLDNSHKNYGPSKLINIGVDGSMLIDNEINDIQYYPIIDETKPYLRPLSSMTEDENKEAKENGCIIYCDTSPEDKGLLVFASPKGFDWLNKKMFDYRKDDEGKTMIEKGLALETPEGMYKV